MGMAAIVGVHHVACATSAAAIVAGMVIGAKEVERGSSKRVLANPMNTGSVRFSVPKPRLDSRSRGRPVLRAVREYRFQRESVHRVQRFAACCPDAKLDTDKADQGWAKCLLCGSLQALVAGQSATAEGARSSNTIHHRANVLNRRRRCYRVQRPIACNRESSCSYATEALRWHGTDRRRYERLANHRGLRIEQTRATRD